MPFQTLILAFTISWKTALMFILLRTEFVHLYTDSLKVMLKSFRCRIMRHQSDLSRLFQYKAFAKVPYFTLVPCIFTGHLSSSRLYRTARQMPASIAKSEGSYEPVHRCSRIRMTAFILIKSIELLGKTAMMKECRYINISASLTCIDINFV